LGLGHWDLFGIWELVLGGFRCSFRSERCSFRSERGVVLLFTFILTFMLTTITVIFLNTVSFEEKRTRFPLVDRQTLNTAEAGLNKAVWYLQNEAPDNTTDGSWRGAVSEAVGGNSYAVTVANLNLSLEPGTTATALSQSNPPANAIDNNTGSSWRSSGPVTQWLRIAFPASSIFYVNAIRLVVRNAQSGRPKNYSWETSSDGATWSTVATVTNATYSGSNDRVDTFSPQAGVNFLQLTVTDVYGGGNPDVRVAEIDVRAVRIDSTCTITSGGQAITHTVTQKAIVDTSTGVPQVTAQPKSWTWQ